MDRRRACSSSIPDAPGSSSRKAGNTSGSPRSWCVCRIRACVCGTLREREETRCRDATQAAGIRRCPRSAAASCRTALLRTATSRIRSDSAFCRRPCLATRCRLRVLAARAPASAQCRLGFRCRSPSRSRANRRARPRRMLCSLPSQPQRQRKPLPAQSTLLFSFEQILPVLEFWHVCRPASADFRLDHGFSGLEPAPDHEALDVV